MRGVTLHGLDQVGNEVVPLPQLHVDVGKGLIDPLPHGDEAVVDRDRPQHEDDDDGKDDDCRGGHKRGSLGPWGWRPWLKS